MSELRRLSVEEIERDAGIIRNALTTMRYLPGISSGQGQMAPSSAEAIAMQTIEYTATLRAYRTAIEAVDRAYKRLTTPEEVKGGER